MGQRVVTTRSALADDTIRDWGAMAARVWRALRGYWHPSASRVMLWDAQHALRLRPMLDGPGTTWPGSRS